jgi:hypothetical protein
MGRRTKQSLKRRAKTHKTEVLKLRKRKNRRKATNRRHQNRARRRRGGKNKK